MLRSLAWATDVHLDHLPAVEGLLAFADELGGDNPDAVLLTGDISVSARLEVDLELLVDQLGCPLYFLLGNHESMFLDFLGWTDDAYFGIPAGKLGLVVNHWTLQRLALNLGFGAARLMVLTAETFTSDDAWRLGFTQVRGDLDAAVALARRSADLAPLSLQGSKIGLNLVERALDEPEFNAAFERAWNSADLAEGRLAFAERRSPVFKGV